MFRGGKISGPNWKRRIACRRVSPPRRTSPDYSRAGNHGAKRTMLARSVSEDNSQPSPRLLFYSSRLVRDRESSEMVTNNFLEFNVSGTLRVPRTTAHGVCRIHLFYTNSIRTLVHPTTKLGRTGIQLNQVIGGSSGCRGIYAPLPRSGPRPDVYAGFAGWQSRTVPIRPPSRRQRRRDGGRIGGHNACTAIDPPLKDGPNTASRKRPLKRPQLNPTKNLLSATWRASVRQGYDQGRSCGYSRSFRHGHESDRRKGVPVYRSVDAPAELLAPIVVGQKRHATMAAGRSVRGNRPAGYTAREESAEVGVPALAGIMVKNRLKAGLQRDVSSRAVYNAVPVFGAWCGPSRSGTSTNKARAASCPVAPEREAGKSCANPIIFKAGSNKRMVHRNPG